MVGGNVVDDSCGAILSLNLPFCQRTGESVILTGEPIQIPWI